ncbi:MAG: glycosyltransferase [Ignavibacteriae bacterium]|nr:MAG: glycosyltransferase [Ignavibacteriota bacterium]
MKIAFLSPFYPYRGGIAQFSDSLFEALSKEHDVKAFTFIRQYPKILFPGTSQFVLDEDIKRDINAVRVLDSINPFTYWKTAKRIDKFKPDLIITSYWMPFFAPSFGIVSFLLKRKGYKIISILHNVIPHEKRTGDVMLTKFFFRQNTGLIVLNDESRKDLEKLMPGSKFFVHPHPLYNHYGNITGKAEARKSLNIPGDKKVILFFGFIRDYKGLDILLESMNELDESYHLIIAGEVYGSFQKYKDIIDKYSLQDKISLHIKYIPDSKVSVYFSAADVTILPYRSGTQSGIIGISYHFDTPVIVADTGGLKEMVENEKTGLIITSSAPELIAKALKKYFDEELKETFQPNIIEFKKKYSWEGLAEAITNFDNSIN